MQEILVLGGTGKTGRRIVEGLQKQGVPVRVGSRSAAIPFTWEDPKTWPAVLEGIKTIFVNYVPDLACDGSFEAMTAFAQQMKQSGVEKVVLLSGRGEPKAHISEEPIKGFDWTVLRCSFFAQNFSEGFFTEPLQHGTLALPVDAVLEPFIDVEDIAAVAVKVLTESGHTGKTYELTGPRAMSFHEAVQIVGRAANRDLQFQTVPLDAYIEGARQMQIPEVIVDLMIYLFGEVLDGRNTPTSDHVEQILGRPARSLETYAQDTAKTGIWSVQS
jgi:uncharacterized protein YbjT (DUF2867 family)